MDANLRSINVFTNSSKKFNINGGNLSCNMSSINNYIDDKLVFSNHGETIFKNVGENGDLLLYNINGNIRIRSGQEDKLLYNFENEEELSNYVFFTNKKIVIPFENTEDILNLRDNSLLIENLNTEKTLSLYSNNGINHISHNNINIVSDKEVIIQGANHLNFTSMGYISFNSQRYIAAAEENITMVSSTGEILLGGDGVSNIGIKINSNLNKNFTGFSLPVMEEAEDTIHINANKSSKRDNSKGGILLESNNEKISPELQIHNKINDSLLNIGVSEKCNPGNLIIFRLEKIDNSFNGNLYYLKSTNNYNFQKKDENTNINLCNGKVLLINEIILGDSEDLFNIENLYNSNDIDFNNGNPIIHVLSKDKMNTDLTYNGYIERNNVAYLRSENCSYLNIGNNNDTLFLGDGKIGINEKTPGSNLEIKNNYGTIFNNHMDSNKSYFNHQIIQINDGNNLLLCCSHNKSNNNYYLEGFIYNSTHDLVKSIIIHENTEIIYFNACRKNELYDNDEILLAYCDLFEEDDNQTYRTLIKNINIKGIIKECKMIVHYDSFKSSKPLIKNIKYKYQNLLIRGYILFYNDSSRNTELINSTDNYCNFYDLDNNLLNKIPYNLTHNFVKELNFDYDSIEIINTSFDINSNELVVINHIKVELEDSDKFYSIVQRKNLEFEYNNILLKNALINNEYILNIKKECNLNTVDLFNSNLIYINNNKFIIGFYSSDNNIYRKVYTLEFNLNNTIDENMNQTKDTKKIYKINRKIYEIKNFKVEDYNLKPCMNKVNENEYLLSYFNENIKYGIIDFGNNDSSKETHYNKLNTIETNSKKLGVTTIKSNYIFKEFIISWNEINPYNGIYFKAVESNNNLFRVSNLNSNFEIKDNGKINIEGEINIKGNLNLNGDINGNIKINGVKMDNKNDNICKEMDIVTSQDDIFSNKEDLFQSGIMGEFRHYRNELYIYLGVWKKVKLEES